MYKYAKSRNGALGQSVGSSLYQGAAAIPGVGPFIAAPDTLMGTIGLMTGSASDKALDRYDRTVGVDVVPGVSSFRAARRRKRLSKDLGGSAFRPWGETFGGLTSAALLLIAGGLVGSQIGDTKQQRGRNATKGMLIGGGTALASPVIGALTAAATRTRDRQAQQKYEKSVGRGAANWFLPGFASYNKWKSRGHMIRGQGYRTDQDLQE